jgi:hypothetical protein
LEKLLDEAGCKRPYSYVDVGCFHPIEHSNTYRFYQRGGSGLVVDMNLQHEASFSLLRPRDKFVCAAVSDRDEKLAVSVAGRPSDRITGHAGAEKGDVMRPVTLGALLGEHWEPGRPIDLFDIDCEGHDFEVLRSNNWDRFRPTVVLVEDFGTQDSSIASFMKDRGYNLALRVGASCVHVDIQRACRL